MLRLKDKTAIITGASRGIGYAIADAYLREGANVVITASRKETAERAQDELQKKYPDAKVKGIYPDLSSLKEVKKAFDQVIEEFGKVDILVNNAGISESTPFLDYTEETFDKVMDLNVKGVFTASHAIAKHMVERAGGVIINTSSMVSFHGQPGGVAYPTSKFAVNGFTLSLARELAPKGVRVNAVAPGITSTDMVKALPEEMIAPLAAQIPLKRLGQPEDVANAFVFLASDEASYITGEVIKVDGLARA